ncbi:MAG TPA: hypothetical protein VLN48_21675 [Bryobacteraceae bacterium]|nr:hypothetical protein [Bryobacteraceae bacterium]
MQIRPASHGSAVAAVLAASLSILCSAQSTATAVDTPVLTIDQQEAFLRTAKIVSVKGNKKGVTDTVRVTLTDGRITHEANVQRINERKQTYPLQSGTTIFNFKDTYEDNIAAWKLARLLGLDDMLPPSVDRTYQGQRASFTWIINDFQMDEAERMAKKIQPPDPENWAKQINVMHVFDQLIYNWDSNATNLLIDKQWRIWLIDQSRSFRTDKTLQDSKMLKQCDRTLLARMKTLDEAMLIKELRPYVSKDEVKALLARRDLIVKFFEEKGDGALFDRPVRN